MADLTITIRPKRSPAAGTDEPFNDQTDYGQAPSPAEGVAVRPNPPPTRLGRDYRSHGLARLAGGSEPGGGDAVVSLHPQPQQEPPSRTQARRPDAQSLNELGDEEEGGLPEGLGWEHIIGELPPEGDEDMLDKAPNARAMLERERAKNALDEEKYKTETDEFRPRHH
jgi:hypothetical protein